MFETKKQKENLRTLILSHEHAIDRWSDRLSEVEGTDPQALLVRTQIEFLILNAENLLNQHENTLASAEEVEWYMAEHPTIPGVLGQFPVMPNPYQNFKPHPNVPMDDVVATRFYGNLRNPVCALCVFVMKDGRLVDPVDAREWPTPTEDEWRLIQEKEGAVFTL